MQAIKMTAHADSNGIIRLEIPTSAIDEDVEVVIVLHSPSVRDAMGYPIGYFEETYGSIRR